MASEIDDEEEQKVVRLIVNLTPKSYAALQEIAQLTEMRRTDIVNRALQLYCWWERASYHGYAHWIAKGLGFRKVRIEDDS